MPEDRLPNMKPTGFPEPRAPVALFLRLPSGYVANRVPIAGGEIAAVPRPRNPQRTFKAIALGAKAVISETRLRNPIPPRSWILRPRRSAVFPENSINDPLPRLLNVSYRFQRVTYDVNTLSQRQLWKVSESAIIQTGERWKLSEICSSEALPWSEHKFFEEDSTLRNSRTRTE